jgi:threonylcarbamoyladenosine tRNA methylthiotransferase MtaB
LNKENRGLRVALDTLGCKLNQAETEALTEKFVLSGYKVVTPDDDFDVYVLNTCTVTHIADRKVRHLLRMAHRRNPEAVLVATGCYAEHALAELSEIEGVKLVVGNDRKMHLPQLLKESGDINQVSPVRGRLSDNLYTDLRTRSFISVQDGCNNFCAYCIVPYVRGREKSVPAGQVVSDIKDKVSHGYKEVVLTGTEIGSYSYNGLNLKGLIDIILVETDIQRLRLSSLQPQEVTPELIALWHDERLCPHFHLSLQSGSDTVLKRMKRFYTTTDYNNAVSLIRSVAGDAAITTDIIVGFPGETDEEFEESYNFCKNIGFARIHVFSYSKRRGTAANIMPNQISPQIKKQRSDKMLALAGESALQFHQKFLDKNISVLWEQSENDIWNGLTGNYIKVYTRSNDDLTNKITTVHLERIYEDGVWGEIRK